jgi:hypothetical protein
MGRPGPDSFESGDLVERQIQSRRIAPDMEPHSIDPSWRGAEKGDLIDRWDLCGHA